MKPTIYLATCVLLLVTSSAVAALESNRSIVNIAVERRGKVVEKGLGVLVAEGRVMTSRALLERGEKFIISFDAQKVFGERVQSEVGGVFALLTIPRLADPQIARFAQSMPAAGREVLVQLRSGEKMPGRLAAGSATGSLSVQPISELSEHLYMKVVFNNCAEIIGVIGPELPQRRRTDTNVPLALVPLAPLTTYLESQSIAKQVASDECLDPGAQKELQEKREAEAAANLEEERRKRELAEDSAKQKEEELEEKERVLSETATRAEALAVEKEQANRDKEAADTAAKDAKAAADAAAEQASAAAAAAAAAADQARTLELEKAGRTRQLYLLAGVAGLLLVASIGGVRAVGRRRRALDEERLKAAQLESSLNIAKKKLSEASATFSDILLSGTDEEGVSLRLKINGDALARAQGGQTFGRHPETCELVLNHPEISREHLRFKVEDGGLWVTELRTVNGTSVNGASIQPMKPTPLLDGDTIEIGGIKLGVRFL